jgi:HNH endonuclease
MENKLGRPLHSKEHVHHEDENKRNDNQDNLKLLENREHARVHQSKRVTKMLEAMCRNCEKVFSLSQRRLRLRIKANKFGLFCSRSCGAKFRQRQY